MLNLLKAELRKLKASKMFYFFIFLGLLQAAFVYPFSEKLAATNGRDTLSYMFFLQLSLSTGILIGVFVVDMVCSEYASGYIKNLIAYGHKRRDIYLAKVITASIGMCPFTFIGPIVIMIVNTNKNGFGEVFTVHSFLFIIGVFLCSLVIHITIVSIAVLISFVVKNTITGSTIIVVMDFINRLLNLAYTQNPKLRGVLGKNPYMQLSVPFTEEVTSAQSMRLLIIFLCTILASTVLGIYIFNRLDI